MADPTQLPILDTKVGFYRHVKDNAGNVRGISVKDIITKINGPELRGITQELRSLTEDKYDRLKRTGFPAVTWSGLFHPVRSKGTLVEHSGLMCLDFDHLSGEKLKKALSLISGDPFTFISFISPSGNGIKAVVRLAIKKPGEHGSFFDQLRAYFMSSLGLEADRSGRDVCRLCLLPHDPDVYINPNSKVFQLDETVIVPSSSEGAIRPVTEGSSASANDDEVFEWCLKVHNRRHTFAKGQRNHYLTALANFCNDYGVSKGYCESQCLARFTERDFAEREIKSTINSVYMKTHQHGYKQYIPQLNKTEADSEYSSMDLETEDIKGNSREKSPIIPRHVYRELPGLLRRMCQAFDTDRERDTFLTSALVVLSGCFPTVSGIYSGVRVFPNLYGFIVAPAASGKGAMGWAKRIALGHHRNLMDGRTVAGNTQIKSVNGEEPNGEGNPNFPSMLFFPANSSGASVINALDNNNGVGIVFESEADTLSATLGQDWGNYSDMLRKAFHHETVSYMRMRENAVIEIESPKLSVCLSGTPAQVQRLIPNAEDGLFSRFIFYGFSTQPEWRSVAPSADRVNLDEYFNELQREVTALIDSIEGVGPIDFTLAGYQWEELDDTFGEYLREVHESVGGNVVGSVKRLGLITFRIAMLLSVVRHAETGGITGQIVCSDLDFRIAMDLAATYLQHSLTTYANLPQEKNSVPRGLRITEKEEKFREVLRLKGTGLSNRKIADRLGTSEATVRNWLKESA